jgi:2-polyprenyl-3-methyl-5-hydroxy-6-metoxy-1,4-benzoquinol methylase
MDAYADAEDSVSVREEEGQVETARRALALIETHVPPGRVIDIGCWTGSFLVAAAERGWNGVGLEPSSWGARRAQERGVDARVGDLFDHDVAHAQFHLAVMCDVLEHLLDPTDALARVTELLEPQGVICLTVPNAGSLTARILGRRWWSVLPMHLQYFTPRSLRLLLERSGYVVLNMGTHAKVFSVRYYAERLAGYSPALGRLAVAVTANARVADRMVAPDFRDRLIVVARRRP